MANPARNVPRWSPNPSPPRRPRSEEVGGADGSIQTLDAMFPFGSGRGVTSLVPPEETTVQIQAADHEINTSVYHNHDDESGHGVFVTWEDLWVVAGERGILQGLTGYAQPGEVLAIMGPSGCGKSTLLDALAGRLSSDIKQTGVILLNGRGHHRIFNLMVILHNVNDHLLIQKISIQVYR